MHTLEHSSIAHQTAFVNTLSFFPIRSALHSFVFYQNKKYFFHKSNFFPWLCSTFFIKYIILNFFFTSTIVNKIPRLTQKQCFIKRTNIFYWNFFHINTYFYDEFIYSFFRSVHWCPIITVKRGKKEKKFSENTQYTHTFTCTVAKQGENIFFFFFYHFFLYLTDKYALYEPQTYNSHRYSCLYLVAFSQLIFST